MAEIKICIGVNGVPSDIDNIMKVLDYIAEQAPEADEKPFVFNAYEEDITDGAIGVLASMSLIAEYTGIDGNVKEYKAHLMQLFERTEKDGKPVFSIIIPSLSRKLIRIVFETREMEYESEEKQEYTQKAIERIGLT